MSNKLDILNAEVNMTLSMCLLLMGKFSAADAVPADQLCPAIIASAKEHSVSPFLVAKIVLHESKGRENAYNSKSQDIGIMQINLKTARAYGFTNTCLHSWRCNLDVGVYVLSEMLHRKHTRICSYNVGNHFEKKLMSCLTYEAKLAKIN